MPTINLTNATLNGSLLNGLFNGTAQQTEEFPDMPERPERPTEPPPETGDGWEPPAYLRTDVRTETPPKMSKPAYLKPYTDPIFGTTIVRITGDPGTPAGSTGTTWPDVARHHYNSDQAWSWDGKYIYLESSGLILDGDSYEVLFKVKNKPSDADVRWWQKDPALMICAYGGDRLGLWNPKTGDTQLIREFEGYTDCKFGPWEGSPSDDGDMVVISYDGGAFAYRISDNKKYPDIEEYSGVGNVRISPLGKYIVWGLEPDHVIITDLEGNEITDLPDNTVSHFDVTVGPDGEEYVVGRVNSSSVGMGKSGRIARHRMRDGTGMGLNTGGWCSHTSTRSTTRKWAVSAPTDEDGSNPPYDGELVMSALDGSVTYRLGHTHEPPDYDYDAQTQPSHSPDG